ncbi:uncharacterized protein DDB_G0284459-like isoform X1 [Onthophagus taurus]|uniref:uncharacterized protein DDB_G0284459-like isoform X1 n=1 Tax=Onthophagus taurus TaxID=166361 RepID=UPI0039BDF0A4
MSEVEEINKLEEASLQNSWVFVEDCDIDSPQNKYYLNCSTEPITELTDTVDKNDLETDSDGISVISESDEAKEVLADEKDAITPIYKRDCVNDDINSTWRFRTFAVVVLLLALFVPMLLNYVIYSNNNLDDVSEYNNNDYLDNDVDKIGQELININIEPKFEVANNDLNESDIKEVEVVMKDVKKEKLKVNKKEKVIKEIDVITKSSNPSNFKENKIRDVKVKDKSKGNKQKRILKEEKKSDKVKKCKYNNKNKEIKGDKKFKYENIKDKDKKMKKSKERNDGKEHRKNSYYPEKNVHSKSKVKYPHSEKRKEEKNKPYLKTENNKNYKKTTKTNKVKIINNNNNLRWKLDEYYFSSRIDKKKIFNSRTKEQFYVMEEQYTSYFKRVIF